MIIYLELCGLLNLGGYFVVTKSSVLKFLDCALGAREDYFSPEKFSVAMESNNEGG